MTGVLLLLAKIVVGCLVVLVLAALLDSAVARKIRRSRTRHQLDLLRATGMVQRGEVERIAAPGKWKVWRNGKVVHSEIHE